MYDKLIKVEEKFIEFEKSMSDPKILQDQNKYKKLVKEHSDLKDIVSAFRQYKKVLSELEESNELLQDADSEIKELAVEEISSLKNEKQEIEDQLKVLLTPKDPNDDKNILLEIRAGTGGEEAGLFASDLLKMYCRYAENKNWKVEIMNYHSTGVGGIKEVIAMIHGKGAYSCFKYESGTHRVQRVPETEAQGRIHTSAVTVAVLPEAEDVDVSIDQNELKVDVYRSQGPGGQSVNTTDSAVRITHIPTGIVVTCQDEKSQLKNKNKAMKVLRARLLDNMIKEQNDKRSEERKIQVGTGDRSGRIRTYNFPQGRVTDHRIGLTLYKLDNILQGEIDEFILDLRTHFQAESLKEDPKLA